MKQAYADGILSDDAAWLQMMQDRNITSHLYDEAAANAIYQKIEESYCAMLTQLAARLNQ